MGSEKRCKQERGVWEGHEKTPKIWRTGTVQLVLHMENRISGPNSIFKVKTITGPFDMPKSLSLSHWVPALIMSFSSPHHPNVPKLLYGLLYHFCGTLASMPWEELPITSHQESRRKRAELSFNRFPELRLSSYPRPKHPSLLTIACTVRSFPSLQTPGAPMGGQLAYSTFTHLDAYLDTYTCSPEHICT